MPTIQLTFANKSTTPLMVQIEPEGGDFWLLPDEEFNFRAEAEKDNGQFEVQHCNGYIAVFPSVGVGCIGVFQGGVELECGHKRPPAK